MADTKQDPKGTPASGVTRRVFLRNVGAAAVAAETLLPRLPDTAAAADGATPGNAPVSGDVSVSLSINGQQKKINVEPRTTLLSAIRDRLEPALTGPKLVCDAGTCGACTVLLDGKPVYGCSVLAIDTVGRQITTVEGLGTPENLSPVQKAFVEKDAMMCGFCTSGFVTTVTALVRDNPQCTLDEVREGCKGNFCRCGTFPHVFQAALAAAGKV